MKTVLSVCRVSSRWTWRRSRSQMTRWVSRSRPLFCLVNRGTFKFLSHSARASTTKTSSATRTNHTPAICKEAWKTGNSQMFLRECHRTWWWWPRIPSTRRGIRWSTSKSMDLSLVLIRTGYCLPSKLQRKWIKLYKLNKYNNNHSPSDATDCTKMWDAIMISTSSWTDIFIMHLIRLIKLR